MLDSFKTSGYKVGVPTSVPQWDITFTSTDFQAMTAYATITGPISLIVDIDASGTGYPTYYGIEIRTVDRSLNITDAPQVAFVPRNERKTVSPSSVPQLAYITGEITSIIIHCFGFASADASSCKISIRIGPSAPLTAPVAPIGRSTMVVDPGVIFGSGNGVITSIPAATNGTNILTFNISTVSGIRIFFHSIQIILGATPSYAGDLIAHIEVVNRVAQTLELAQVPSNDDIQTTFIYPFDFVLDVGCTLLINVDNLNTDVAYNAQYAVFYSHIY